MIGKIADASISISSAHAFELSVEDIKVPLLRIANSASGFWHQLAKHPAPQKYRVPGEQYRQLHAPNRKENRHY
jgi:hypothetical protein